MPSISISRRFLAPWLAQRGSGGAAPYAPFTAWALIGGPIAGLFGLVALMGFVFFRAVALDHDATSRRADIDAMAHILQATKDGLQAMVREYAYWDAGFQSTTVRWDPTFAEDNFYSDLVDTFVVVSGAQGVRYSWTHPQAVVSGPALAQAALAAAPTGLTRADFLVGEEQSVTPLSFMRSLDGALLLVSVLAIHPETPALLSEMRDEKDLDVLVVGSIIDAAQMSEIGARLGLSGAQFSVTPDLRPGRASLALGDPSAEPIGYVSWQDRKPGSAAFHRQISLFLSGLSLLTLLAAWVIARSVQHSLRVSEAARVSAEAAQRAAEQANLAKSQFLAAMSHELRTPLNAIIGYSEMLRESADEDERESDSKDAGNILGAGQHLLSLINQVLDHAAIESGSITLNAAPARLAALAEDVVAMASPIARRNETTLDLVLDDTLGVAVVDAVRLKQCLMNIVGNAVKFTQSGVVRVECVRRPLDGQEWAQFTVSDTGIGMAPETLARLFTPFMQADTSFSRPFEGTGLGLAITKRLIEALEGQIEVRSALGEGTTVTLRVPLLASEDVAVAA